MFTHNVALHYMFFFVLFFTLNVWFISHQNSADTVCLVLLSPFQLAWISGVRLLTSLWNCFLASLSRSLYWETILASDSAVCTCGQVCT